MGRRGNLLAPPHSLGGSVVNLYHQQSRSTNVQYKPESIEDLVASVIDVSTRDLSGVRAGGSYFSLSSAAMPDTAAIHTRTYLDCHLARPAAMTGTGLLDDRYRSTAHQDFPMDSLISDDWSTASDERPLIFCEAGIQIRQLIGDLTQMGLALPTMGSGSTQTLAGAVATGTHGSDWAIPPLGDFVRAIHLVTSGGQEWWIEGSEGVTDGPALRSLPHWDSEIRVVRDDEMLAAAQVAVGRFGVWYSVILEVVPQYGLERNTFDIPWETFKSQLEVGIESGYEAPGAPLADGRIRAYEAIYAPNQDIVRVTTRRVSDSVTEATGDTFNSSSSFFDDLLCKPVHAALGIGTSLHAFSAVVDTIGAGWAAVPIAGWIKAVRYHRAAHRLRVLGTAINTGHITGSALVTRLIAIFRDDNLSELRDPLAKLLGSALLDKERKTGTFTGLSYEMMDTGNGNPVSGPVGPNGPEAGCVLVDSTEVFFDARSDRLVEYVDRLRNRFRDQRPTEIFFTMRLSGRSRALIGMEQFAPTMAVEVAALQPFQTDQVRTAAAEGVSAGGILHWGQMVPESYNADTVGGIFGDKLASWRKALAYLEERQPESTFTTRHSESLGLEWSGYIPSSTRFTYNEDPRMFEAGLIHPHL